jgi:hypothetical protein
VQRLLRPAAAHDGGRGGHAFDQLVADAGYDSEANHRHCRAIIGADSLIPARKHRSARTLATTPLRLEMLRRLGVPGVEADPIAFRQRWNAETVMSVVKRRCGEALTARLDETQRAQALLRGVAYSGQRLVRLGAPPEASDRASAGNEAAGVVTDVAPSLSIIRPPPTPAAQP